MPGFVEKIKDMWNPPEDEYEYDYAEEPEEVDSMAGDKRESEAEMQQRESARRMQAINSGNKVVNIHATAQLQVVLFKPERFGEETCATADELLKMHTVVLNLENTNKDVSRRIIDFLSGVAYANGGKIKRVATSTFIITPYNVDLTGDDVLDELESNGVYF
ncbi:Cell division protein SepF [Caprobacter fermentans]|uniref:Cell division protein SepF n=1 Tax=Caproicibacter fermentans TaxID=2576756 RepID=A0A6N8HYW1_9FIRM|nr:cell division protein SepF [Caproicibacter fermentans]MVB10667.1 Cell division protein SepF [Caproicibacter fermentans]OCN03277.1 cell division protein SepF [Clostridium sp. W14A]QNK40902.1 cell division protein SepF [Caproicibacter fermentans]